MTHQIPIEIETTGVVFINVDADDFGRLFARMTDDDQVAVLAAMERHMRPHRMQWDFIAIELDKPENKATREALAQALLCGDA